VAEEAVDKAEVAVLLQDQVEIAYAQVVVPEWFINWGFLATSRNAQSAVRL
jgi:hypothetical protein